MIEMLITFVLTTASTADCAKFVVALEERYATRALTYSHLESRCYVTFDSEGVMKAIQQRGNDVRPSTRREI